jgi:hypothetical protein
MLSRVRLLVIGLALAAVLAVTAAASAASTHQASGSKVIHLTQTFGEGWDFDVPPQGPSPGDQFGGPLNWSRGSKVVATVGFQCTLTRLDPPEDQCILSARFAEGVLTAQTLFQETSQAPTDWAITGGTGAYRDAGGFLVVHNPDVTLHIDDLS